MKILANITLNIALALVFVNVPIHVYAQSSKLLIDSTKVYSRINTNDTSPQFSKQELSDSISLYLPIFISPRFDHETFKVILLHNIFGDKDSVRMDSNFLLPYIKNYNAFNNAMSSYGIPDILRPDCTINENASQLLRDIKMGRTLLKKWPKITAGAENLLSHGVLKYRKGAVNVNKIKFERRLYHFRKKIELAMKSKFRGVIKKQEIELWLSRISRIMNDSTLFSSSQLELEIYNQLLVSVIERTKQDLTDEIWQLNSRLSYIQNNSQILNEKMFTIASLFRIDKNISYDTGSISQQLNLLRQKIEKRKTHETLEFNQLKIDQNGNYWVNLWQVIGTTKEPLYECVKSIFSLPSENFDLTVNSVSKMGGGKQTKKIRVQSDFMSTVSSGYNNPIISPCIPDFCADTLTINKNECEPNSELKRQYYTLSTKSIERLIYSVMRDYFISQNIDEDKITRIKTENGNIFASIIDVRKVILKNENYWEHIKLYFIVSRLQEGLKLCLRIDPGYGTGIRLGNFGRPPSSYDPMIEKIAFQERIKLFCNETLYNIKDLLIQNK
ncbi:MAG: hypothetical protein IPP81_16070 [Chitinophagaceae bacterium]|nr:hypothetical protein [Chitinophagaceae bacterium]